MKEYKNYEVAKVVDVNGYQKVLREIRKRCRKNANTLSLLTFDWPATSQVMEELCLFITEGILSNNEPIIYSVIEEALEGYRQVVFHENDEKHEDPVRLGVFIESLISETSRALELEATDEEGKTWTAEQGISFSNWLQICTGDISVVSRKHESECQLRSELYNLMTGDSVKRVLQRTNYEEAVVAGRMAVAY